MSHNAPQKCLTCRFWEPLFRGVPPEDYMNGSCIRHAPVLMPIVTLERKHAQPGDWPTTQGHQWCGDWTPKETDETDVTF